MVEVVYVEAAEKVLGLVNERVHLGLNPVAREFLLKQVAAALQEAFPPAAPKAKRGAKSNA